jgi:hypothetical protein
MNDLDRIVSLVKDYQRKNLWGTLVFMFRDGDLVLIKCETTLKSIPPEEKNSQVGARGAHGFNNGESNRV